MSSLADDDPRKGDFDITIEKVKRLEAEWKIKKLEAEWMNAIQAQDVKKMDQFVGPSYHLVIAVEGLPLQIVERDAWLDNLKRYQILSYNILDMRVHVYGEIAAVVISYTQDATVRGYSRSGQFILTDIWAKQGGVWKVVERHTGRPEGREETRPE